MMACHVVTGTYDQARQVAHTAAMFRCDLLYPDFRPEKWLQKPVLAPDPREQYLTQMPDAMLQQEIEVCRHIGAAG